MFRLYSYYIAIVFLFSGMLSKQTFNLFVGQVFCKPTPHIPTIIQYHTSHISNISHPKHDTSQTSHIPNIPHLEYSTSQTTHISNIPHPVRKII